MKPGDLILYHDQHGQLKEKFFGIYISSRGTKWSKHHEFHKILEAGGGIDEFVLRIGNENEVEVVQDAKFKIRRPSHLDSLRECLG